MFSLAYAILFTGSVLREVCLQGGSAFLPPGGLHSGVSTSRGVCIQVACAPKGGLHSSGVCTLGGLHSSGVCTQGGLHSRGVCTQGGLHSSGVCTQGESAFKWGVHPRGVYLQGGLPPELGLHSGWVLPQAWVHPGRRGGVGQIPSPRQRTRKAAEVNLFSLGVTIFTIRNEVAKVMFLYLSVILFAGGVCLSACWDTTLGKETPQTTHPPRSRHTPQSRYPSGKETPLLARKSPPLAR